jgi:hypothetical protein
MRSDMQASAPPRAGAATPLPAVALTTTTGDTDRPRKPTAGRAGPHPPPCHLSLGTDAAAEVSR